MKKKQDNKIILFLIGVMAILLIILLSLELKDKKLDYSELSTDEIDEVIESEINEIEINTLATLDEGERIEKYAAKFMEKVDNEEYETAYNMLYGEFKENYFPTLESFEKYSKETFPKLMSLEYTNIERNGNIYVLWVTLKDFMKPGEDGVEYYFVIRENKLNDFELSFSAN